MRGRGRKFFDHMLGDWGGEGKWSEGRGGVGNNSWSEDGGVLYILGNGRGSEFSFLKNYRCF